MVALPEEAVQSVLYALAFCSLIAFAGYVRSLRHRRRFVKLVTSSSGKNTEAYVIASANYRKEIQATILYLLLTPVAILLGLYGESNYIILMGGLLAPTLFSIWQLRDSVNETRILRSWYDLENRYRDTLSQSDLAPKAWAARLAPEQLPHFSGFEIGRVYEAGSGLMSGDFFDVCRLDTKRIAAVIGDVSGHNIESSLTAFQAKYLLRVFLHQFRDPAQALEEINKQLVGSGGIEEFISACVVVCDTEANTVRYASAGHPAAFMFQQEGVKLLRSTGPLLMLDPNAEYFSREFPMESGDLVVMYTDGLSEARTSSGALFEERKIVKAVERNLTAAPDVLCKSLLDDAKDFAGGSVNDDTAIMALRKD